MAKFLSVYVSWLNRFSWIFLLVWLAAAVSSAFFVFDFINNTKLSFHSPSGTPVATATDERAKHFPQSADQADISFFALLPTAALGNGGKLSATNERALPQFVAADTANTTQPTVPATSTAAPTTGAPSTTAAATTSSPASNNEGEGSGSGGGGTPCVNKKNAAKVARSIAALPSVELFFFELQQKAAALSGNSVVENYFLLKAIGAGKVASGLLSARGNMLLLPVVAPFSFGGASARSFAKDLNDLAKSIAPSVLRNASINLALGDFGGDAEYVQCVTQQLTLGATGVPIMEMEMVTSSQKSLGEMDAITIPLALIVMGLTVQSLRLLLIPMLCIGGTLLIAFGIMYPVSKVVAVVTAAPSLMMSLTISMSTDYCMFVLSRFVEEVRNGQKGAAAVFNTLATAGHTILVSGLTLCASFIALCFFPTDLLKSFGLSCSITVAMALLLSLNLTPCMLLAFADFFERAAYPIALPDCLPRWRVFEYLGFYLPSMIEGAEGGGYGSTRQSGVTPTRQIRASGSHSPVPTLDISEGVGHAGGSPPLRAGGGIRSPTESDGALGGHSLDAVGAKSLGASYGAQQKLGASSHNSSSGNDNDKNPFAPPSAKEQAAAALPGGNAKSKGALSSATITMGSEHFDPALNPVPTTPIADTPNWTTLITKERTAQYGQSVGDSVFFRLQPILSWPWNLVTIVLLTGVIGYVGSITLDLKLTDNMQAFLSRGSSSRNDLLLVRREYGAGAVFPYQLMFVLDDDENGGDDDSNNDNDHHVVTDIVLNQSALELTQFVVRAVANKTGSALTAFQGPMIVGGMFPTAAQILNCTKYGGAPFVWHNNESSKNQSSSSIVIPYDPLLSPTCDKNILAMLSNQTLNARRTASMVTFVTTADPTGNEGRTLYDNILAAAKERPPVPSAAVTNNNPNATEAAAAQRRLNARVAVYVLGVGAQSEDVIQAVYAHFVPLAVAVIVAVVVLCGITFRSVVVPIRTLLSIAYTELFVFGFTTAVYQIGIFSWMNDPHVANEGAISWLSPIVASLVIVGLATDFDVLIMLRIQEFVSHEGVTTAEGTLLGLCATGKIVTACGITMAIAFAGLVMTDQTLVNELGLMLCAAALFDTFIVRTLLVPATISLLGKYHWWPNKVEEGSFSHIFGPSDSISARASLVRNSAMAGGGGGADGNHRYSDDYRGAGAGGNYGTSRLYEHVEASRLNKSNQLLEQQRQRLQHLFGD